MSGCCGAWSGLRIDLRVAQGGWGAGVEGVGGWRFGAARMGLCVSTSREDLWSSLQVETHSLNQPARRPGAFFCAW